MKDSVTFQHRSRIASVVIFSLLGLFLLLSLWVVFFPARKDYEHMVRSSSLRQVTTEDGNVTEITFVDEDGVPTVAANTGYATVRRTKEPEGMYEEYLDEKGERIRHRSGYYVLFREYDDEQHEVKAVWQDDNGEPCVNTSGYAMLERTFNEDGRTDTEKYLGPDGAPVETQYYGYGRRLTYDDQGRVSVITYIDQDGNAVITGQGFAAMKRDFFKEEGLTDRVERDYYLDEMGRPMPTDNGTYARKLGFDELGRNNSVTCLDQNGEPIMTKEGFCTLCYTFYNDDSLHTVRYLDTEGNPVALGQGQYGLLYEGDSVTYLNADGSERFSLKNLLHNQPAIAILTAMVMVAASLIFGKRVNYVLLVIALGGIVFMTLMNRSSGAARAQLGLFYSYRRFFSDYTIRKEILDNIWLFIPLGTVLYRLWPKRWIWVVPVVLSVGIEGFQYVTGLGTAELDDVISNGIGGAMGIAVAWVAATWRQSDSRPVPGSP